MKISQAVWVRIVIFVLAWVNVGLVKFFNIELPIIGEELIATFIAAIISVWTTWKDNPTSKNALQGEELLKRNGLK